MRNRRRRKPVPPRPNVSVYVEQMESRFFPNDLLSLLGASVVGGGFAFLNQPASPRRPQESGGDFVSPAARPTPVEPPAVPALVPPPYTYDAHAENAGA